MTSTAEQQAQQLYQQGATLRQIADTVGVHFETIRRWANRYGWTRDTAELEQAAAARRQKVEQATAAAKIRWAERRAAEADAAGITAARARQGIIAALDARDPQMTRAAAIAYGILIDKAQILTGGATENHGVIDPTESRERLAKLIDLAAHRDVG
jgi:hypothetical protein